MGKIRRNHKLSVKVPAGIDDGQAIPIPGCGNAGANGGPAGDLLVGVIVRPHPIFEREGTNVYMEQEISYAQAALGAEVEVPTLDGKVKLTVPEGTQPGAVFRMRGRGRRSCCASSPPRWARTSARAASSGKRNDNGKE